MRRAPHAAEFRGHRVHLRGRRLSRRKHGHSKGGDGKVPGQDGEIPRTRDEQGLPAARNTGLAEACGEYVLLDSDDWLEPTIFEKLYLAACRCGRCRHSLLRLLAGLRRKAQRHIQSLFHLRQRNWQEGIPEPPKYNVWNKLVQRPGFSGGISFPEGHAARANVAMIPVTARATRVVHVEEALYHYFKLNPGAYSNTFSAKHLEDIRFNVDRSLGLLHEGFSPKRTKPFQAQCQASLPDVRQP